MAAAAFRDAQRHADTRFGRIAYAARGTGDAAVFLHGFPLSGYQWRGALDRLAPHRRCVAPDFLALGETRVAPGQSVAPDAQVGMLLALLDALAIPRADVVASDSGGAVAQLLMTQHPERVRTLLLTNCDVEGDSPPPAMRPVIAMAHAGTYPDAWLAPWLADKALARSPRGLGGTTYTHLANPHRRRPRVLPRAARAFAGAQGARERVRDRARARPPRGRRVGASPVAVPTRIVWGTGDTIFSPRSPAYLDRVLGASRGVRAVPAAKLFFPEEYPDLIAAEARRLWEVG